MPLVRLAPLLLALLFGAGQAQAEMSDPMPLADHVVVDKSHRTIALYSGGQLLRTIPGIQLGDAPSGHKQFQGDERTPEGRYTIDYGNPESAYHLSLHISYPNDGDTGRAQSQGRSPGGAIFIHGQPNGWQGRIPGDWTDGCIAVSNEEIEFLWQTVPDGTVIDILP